MNKELHLVILTMGYALGCDDNEILAVKSMETFSRRSLQKSFGKYYRKDIGDRCEKLYRIISVLIVLDENAITVKPLIVQYHQEDLLMTQTINAMVKIITSNITNHIFKDMVIQMVAQMAIKPEGIDPRITRMPINLN